MCAISVNRDEWVVYYCYFHSNLCFKTKEEKTSKPKMASEYTLSWNTWEYRTILGFRSRIRYIVVWISIEISIEMNSTSFLCGFPSKKKYLNINQFIRLNIPISSISIRIHTHTHAVICMRVACSRYLRFNWHSIIRAVMWSRWEPFIVTPFISHSHFSIVKKVPRFSCHCCSEQVYILNSNESTHTLRSCYIFGCFLFGDSISGFDGSNHFFLVYFMTKIHDLIPKQKQLSEITAIFRRCSYSACLPVCESVFFHVSCSFAARLLKKM